VNHRNRLMLLAVSMAALTGCGGATRSLTADELPEPFTLQMDMYQESESRAARYVVEADGLFRFDGGQDAFLGEPEVAGRLTEAERRALWRHIFQTGLMEADGSMFADPKRVLYRLDLRADGVRNRFRTIDDRHPAAAELFQMLHTLHADRRYKRVMRMIDSELDRHEGAVPRRE